MEGVGNVKPEGFRGHRAPVLKGETRQVETGCGSLYVTITLDEVGPREIFANMGKAGGCASANCEALGRMVTLALRANVSVEMIIKQLRGIRCHVPNHVSESCADAIARALAAHIDLPVEFGINKDYSGVQNGAADNYQGYQRANLA